MNEATPVGRRPYEGLDGSGTDMGRLTGLSDGVFAFALTFLVVSLILPATTGMAPASLVVYLRRLSPGFLAYALSFFIIATWWDSHHRLFSPIVRYDNTLVRLNNVFLLIISVTPFLVDVLFVYGPSPSIPAQSTELAVVLYAGVQAVGGAVLLLIWRHATSEHRLVLKELPAGWIRGYERNLVLVVVIFLGSMPISLLSPYAAEVVWVAMVFSRVHRRLFRPPATLDSAPGAGG